MLSGGNERTPFGAGTVVQLQRVALSIYNLFSAMVIGLAEPARESNNNKGGCFRLWGSAGGGGGGGGSSRGEDEWRVCRQASGVGTMDEMIRKVYDPTHVVAHRYETG